jgi:hypothetical protein
MTTTERVLEVLTGEGQYKALLRPVKIGSQDFDFTHTLVATEKGNDLVLVIELTGATDNAAVARSILAFTRALDVFGSRRSVTVVFTSGQAEKELLNSINRVCRILTIGAPPATNAAQHLRDWLSVLLPIKIPAPVEHLSDWNSMLKQSLENKITPEAVEQFVTHSNDGREMVEAALAGEISSRADRALEDEDINR